MCRYFKSNSIGWQDGGKKTCSESIVPVHVQAYVGLLPSLLYVPYRASDLSMYSHSLPPCTPLCR